MNSLFLIYLLVDRLSRKIGSLIINQINFVRYIVEGLAQKEYKSEWRLI